MLLDHGVSLRQNAQLRAKRVSASRFRRAKRGHYRPLGLFDERLVAPYRALLEGTGLGVDDVLVQTENSCRRLVPHLRDRYLALSAQGDHRQARRAGLCGRATACRRPDRGLSECALIVAGHLQAGIEAFSSGPVQRLFFEKSPRLSFALLNDAIHILLTVRLMDARDGGRRSDERALLTVTGRGEVPLHVLYTADPSGRRSMVAMRVSR